MDRVAGMSEKLSNLDISPCPFCGSDSADIKYTFDQMGFQLFFIMCIKCRARGPESMGNMGAMECHDLWNKRIKND